MDSSNLSRLLVSQKQTFSFMQNKGDGYWMRGVEWKRKYFTFLRGVRFPLYPFHFALNLIKAYSVEKWEGEKEIFLLQVFLTEKKILLSLSDWCPSFSYRGTHTYMASSRKKKKKVFINEIKKQQFVPACLLCLCFSWYSRSVSPKLVSCSSFFSARLICPFSCCNNQAGKATEKALASKMGWPQNYNEMDRWMDGYAAEASAAMAAADQMVVGRR